MSSIILVTGPARSGKSEWAENLAKNSSNPVVYVATAYVDHQDPEWVERIQLHKSRRPSDWQSLEIPQALPEFLLTAKDQCVLIDSLGSWVVNFLDNDQDSWNDIAASLINSLQQTQANVILVGEETGWGVVPAYPSGRLFRDRLGMLVRNVGAIASDTYLVTAGYVLNLRVLGIPLNS